TAQIEADRQSVRRNGRPRLRSGALSFDRRCCPTLYWLAVRDGPRPICAIGPLIVCRVLLASMLHARLLSRTTDVLGCSPMHGPGPEGFAWPKTGKVSRRGGRPRGVYMCSMAWLPMEFTAPCPRVAADFTPDVISVLFWDRSTHATLCSGCLKGDVWMPSNMWMITFASAATAELLTRLRLFMMHVAGEQHPSSPRGEASGVR